MDEYSILRKKRKKNGFAATSLLISIAIALLVLVGAVLILGKVDNGINKVNDDSNMTLGSGVEMTCAGLTKEMIFNTNIRYMKEAAISYFTNERLPKNLGDTVKITLKEMKDKHLILNVIDSTYKLCADNDSYVEVMKATNEYVMKIMLSCNDMEDYLIVHLGCYDYCDMDVCEKKDEKTYEYEYKKTTSCTMGNWSAWGNWKLTREATSNLKKEDTKVEIIKKDTVYSYDAVQDPVTYNCDKYPGYTRVNNKCVNTLTVDATKTKDTYSCDTNAGYTLVDNKCVKKYQDVKDATKNEATYSCPKGYTRTVINYTVKSGDTLASVAKANNISKSALKLANKLTSDTLKVGQKLTIPVEYQNKCYKNETTTVNATKKYSNREVNSTCYESICTTQLVPSCDNGYCEIEEIRTCEKVPRTCKKTESYVSGYSCAKGTLTSDHKCKITEKKYVDANKNADTYNCDKYDGYTKSGAKCYKDVTDEKQPTVKTGEYVCNTQDGYELSGTKCVKTITKDADKNKVTYSCSVNGYTLTSDNKCTKKVPANTKVTYYRYATRKCTGGSVSVKWSTSANDSILISEGYKPTGVKQVKIDK